VEKAGQSRRFAAHLRKSFAINAAGQFDTAARIAAEPF